MLSHNLEVSTQSFALHTYPWCLRENNDVVFAVDSVLQRASEYWIQTDVDVTTMELSRVPCDYESGNAPSIHFSATGSK